MRIASILILAGARWYAECAVGKKRDSGWGKSIRECLAEVPRNQRQWLARWMLKCAGERKREMKFRRLAA